MNLSSHRAGFFSFPPSQRKAEIIQPQRSLRLCGEQKALHKISGPPDRLKKAGVPVMGR